MSVDEQKGHWGRKRQEVVCNHIYNSEIQNPENLTKNYCGKIKITLNLPS